MCAKRQLSKMQMPKVISRAGVSQEGVRDAHFVARSVSLILFFPVMYFPFLDILVFIRFSCGVLSIHRDELTES